MQSLNQYLWSKQKTFSILAGFILVFTIFFSISFLLNTYKKKQLIYGLDIASTNINSALIAGDWTIVQEILESNIEKSEVNSLTVYSSKNDLLAGPIVSEKLGIFPYCQSRTSKNGIRIEGCVKLIVISDMLIILFILLFMLSILTMFYYLFKKRIKEMLSEIENHLTSIAKLNENENPPQIEILEINNISNRISELLLSINKLNQDKIYNQIAKQVAHDIRSPIASLNLASKSISYNNEASKIIADSIKRINDISEDLLLKAKTSKNSQTCNSSIIQKIIDEKNVILKSKNLNPIRFNFQIKSQLNICINEIELLRILSNLINNSIEALNPSDGLIEINVFHNEQHISIEIKDNGRGIPREILNKIGTKELTSNKSTGHGLGTFHAFNTIKNINGKIDYESQESQGTVVRITIPTHESSINKLKPNDEIILFENDLLVIKAWQIQAKKFGVKIHLFKNFDEFNQVQSSFLNKKNITIFTDLELDDGLSGIEIAQKLHELNFTNIHLCTGHNLDQNEIPNYIKSIIDKSFPFQN